jgi:endonuclease YncB( thermonuclease family)
MSEFCPQCGSERTGAFRFCRHCRFDFDRVATESSAVVGPLAAPIVRRPIASRLTGRQWLGAGVAIFVGLGAIGSLTNSSVPAAGSGPAPVATRDVAAAPTPAPSRPAPSYWATVRPSLAPTGPTTNATVVRIVDGDTIVVAIGGTNYKLRYIGMDTPETVDPNSPVEFMGPHATAANEALVSGREVVLEKDVSETDQYGRLLRYVWLHEGTTWILVNLELVRQGIASAVTYPPDVKYVDLFTAAEAAARTSVVGLWAAPLSAAPTAKATPKPTPRPTPRPTPKPTKKPSSCHPSYTPCLPIVADLDCPDVRAMGKAPVHVIGPDEYRLDGDNDGLGCE